MHSLPSFLIVLCSFKVWRWISWEKCEWVSKAYFKYVRPLLIDYEWLCKSTKEKKARWFLTGRSFHEVDFSSWTFKNWHGNAICQFSLTPASWNTVWKNDNFTLHRKYFVKPYTFSTYCAISRNFGEKLACE